MSEVRLLQTASGAGYLAMLAATEPLHRQFAERHRLEYIKHEGVVRGSWDWQATFNRIDLIGDMLDAGYRGWILYVDADAIIRDPAFPIRAYLEEHKDRALIAVSGTGQGKWDINAGVFFLNLGDARARSMVVRWRDAFRRRVTDAMLLAAKEPWQRLPDGNPFPDDQHLLQMVLLQDENLLEGVLLEQASFMNYAAGSFIRQVIREHGSDRVEQLTALVAQVRADANKRQPRLPALASRLGDGEKAGPNRALVHYDTLFGARRRDRLSVLQIGGLHGAILTGRNDLPVELGLWLDYFPHADVVSIDVIARAKVHRPRLFLHQIDPTDANAVSRIAGACGSLHLVIDGGDGGAEAQIGRFVASFGAIAPGGWYVMEGEAVAHAEGLLREWTETSRFGAGNRPRWRAAARAIGSVHFARVGPAIAAVIVRKRDG